MFYENLNRNSLRSLARCTFLTVLSIKHYSWKLMQLCSSIFVLKSMIMSASIVLLYFNCNLIFCLPFQEIRPWTHMMEVPQLHGFGPAANRLLEAYKMLWKVSQHHFLFFMFIFLKGYMA